MRILRLVGAGQRDAGDDSVAAAIELPYDQGTVFRSEQPITGYLKALQ